MFTKTNRRFSKIVWLILTISILAIGWQVALADDDDDDGGDDDVTPEVTETIVVTEESTLEITETEEATPDVTETAVSTEEATPDVTETVVATEDPSTTDEPTGTPDMTETVVATEDPTSTGTPEVTATETVVVVTQDPDDDDDDDDGTTTPTPVNPTAITVIYPTGGAAITQVSEYQTRIQWLPVDGAQWYHVFLIEDDDDDDDDNTIFYNTWYPATDEVGASNGLAGVCDEALCQTTVDLWLSDDDYVLWMGYWNESLGPNYAQTYAASPFEIDFDDPEVPTNAQVQPATDQSNAALVWDADDHTLWYRIWFGPADYSETVVFQWFAAQDICNAETCTVALPNSPAQGDYELWMELWGPDEYERWERVAEITVTP